MPFSSIVFLFVFLPIVLALYFVGPPRMRNPVLLAASLFFYAWGEQERVAILLACIVVTWACGLAIDTRRGDRGPRAKAGLTVAIVFNVGLLLYYKYGNFALDNLNALRLALGASPITIDHVVLPIGISFFTFQALSYVIDVYRGDVAAQRNVGRFAVYKSLFPQLIAGPIVRYRDVADQLGSRRTTRTKFVAGVRRFVIGLGKKTLIANTAAVTADHVFAIPATQLAAPVAWLGLCCYTLQIYFDFSGYSDMAIGLGRMFGFEIRENFRWPYVATSLTEFWRRWHISLSTWFRDYVYIPLGGNRHGPVRTGANLVLVFALCGLWHGATWTFVVWGLYHGAFLLLERTSFTRALHRLVPPFRHLYLLLVVMVGWVFFRSESLTAAGGYLQALAGISDASGREYPSGMFADSERLLVLIVGVIGSTPWLPALRDALARWEATLAPRPTLLFALGRESLVFAALIIVLLGSAARLASATNNPFIYFRF
jgi:alginate O-acetyltransferase complex protein AlgI